jgi:ATP-dependent DNA helicase 2 subunit 2
MKQALAFVLDASPSMLQPYPKQQDGAQNSTSTRLDCAKQALELMISELMLQSVQNEVCVVVCKTLKTSHHKLATTSSEISDSDNVPFPNLTELTHGGVTRPSIDFLWRIWHVEPHTDAASCLQGAVCDGVILAADALYERTAKRKFQSQIIVLTDADHPIVMDISQTLVVIDSLRSMECRLQVIGLDFEMSAVYDEPAAAPLETVKLVKQEDDDNASKKIKVEEREEDNDCGKVEENVESGSCTEDEGEYEDDEEDEDEQPGIITYATKQDRERLLLSLTEKTGGEVIAASTLQQVLDANKGKRLQTATKRIIELQIAPGLTVEVRYILMMEKQSMETLKTEAVLRDSGTGQPLQNSIGQEMTDNISSITQFVDADNNPDDGVGRSI